MSSEVEQLETADRPIMTAVDPDGFIYDVETGEVLGQSEVRPGWRAEDESDVDWAMEIRAGIESRLAAIRLRKKALLANLEAMERDQERRLAWWDWRFRPDVVAFARRAIEGGKARTARFAHGSIKFRTSAGTNRIIDMDRAVEIVNRVNPDAVRVERSVTTTALIEAAGSLDRSELLGVLESSGPRETVSIETGIGG